MREGRIEGFLLVALAVIAGAGCRSRGIVLYNTHGEQRVYPYFIDQPMVLAFWNASNVQCLDDLPALNTLHKRPGPVHVLGVASGDRLEMNKWMRRMGVEFEVVYDSEEILARRLGVRSYPTYVYFGHTGGEITRSLTIRTIHNWFDRERWLRRAGGWEEPPAPPAGDAPAAEPQPAAAELAPGPEGERG